MGQAPAKREEEPATVKPADAKPADAKPAEAKPAEDKPVAVEVAQPAEERVMIVEANAGAVAAAALDVAGDVIVEEGFAVAGDAVQVFAMAANIDPQGSKLLSKVAVDNALVRRVCKLNEEQSKQLDTLDAKWVKGKAAAQKQAGNLAAGVLRVFAGPNVGAARQDNPAEAASRVTAAYKTKLKEILTAEQLAEFEKNVDEREAFRREANAQCVVAVLEDRLSLNDEQRKALVKSLSAWSGIRTMQATFYFQNQAYIPNLPESVLKALTPGQRKILDGMQKADFQFEMFDNGEEAVFIAR